MEKIAIKKLVCPSCGAPVDITGDEDGISFYDDEHGLIYVNIYRGCVVRFYTCAYCGSSVVLENDSEIKLGPEGYAVVKPDSVGGDTYQVGNITGSVVAIGRNARAG